MKIKVKFLMKDFSVTYSSFFFASSYFLVFGEWGVLGEPFELREPELERLPRFFT